MSGELFRYFIVADDFHFIITRADVGNDFSGQHFERLPTRLKYDASFICTYPDLKVIKNRFGKVEDKVIPLECRPKLIDARHLDLEQTRQFLLKRRYIMEMAKFKR